MSHFKITEFACNCGCGLNTPSQRLLLKLETARVRAGIPFVLVSACRCKKHNHAVGGVDDSAHTPDAAGQCNAVDIQATNSSDRFKIIEALLYAGFTRIGIAKNFIHGDVSVDHDQQVVWVY